MPATMQPLRDEHQELLPHIERLREAADMVGAVPFERLRAAVDEAVDFLVHHLIPHATAEDQVLYPAVQRILVDPQATATMSRDHVEVDRLTHQLTTLRDHLAPPAATLDGATGRELRRVLYGLYALVSAHFAKEEEIYVPLLERGLTEEAAADLFARMHTAAARSRALH